MGAKVLLGCLKLHIDLVGTTFGLILCDHKKYVLYRINV